MAEDFWFNCPNCITLAWDWVNEDKRSLGVMNVVSKRDRKHDHKCDQNCDCDHDREKGSKRLRANFPFATLTGL
jgi:hypothetical protein